ncbi:MAG: O-antigen ligase family protein [Chloroflexi bacterium]|nr:O-antigen ligase family protein [Chloroflexota bacterium]
MNDPALERLQFWRIALTLLAVAAVMGSGVLLGRVLFTPQWTQAVTLIGLGAALLVLLLEPAAGLLLWILLVPYARYIYLRVDMGGGIPDLDLTRLATMLLATLFILQATVRPRVGAAPLRRLARPGWTELAMIAYIAAMGISAAPSRLSLLVSLPAQFDLLMIPLLVYYFARNLLRSERALMATVGVVAISCVLLGVITVREQWTGLTFFSPTEFTEIYELHSRKVMSLFGSPLTIATALAVSLPLLLYGVRQATTLNRRALLGLAVIIALAGLVFAYVRTGWLAAILGFVVVITFGPGLRRAVLPVLLVLVLVAVVFSAVGIISPDVLQERLTSEEPVTYRLQAWSIAWRIFQSSPILGVGYGEYGQRALTEFGFDPHAAQGHVDAAPPVHNTYLDTMVSGGLVAILPFLGIFLSIAQRGRAFWKRGRNRDLVATLWATLVGYLALIGSYDVANSQFGNMLFFLIIGALLGRLEDASGEVLT